MSYLGSVLDIKYCRIHFELRLTCVMWHIDKGVVVLRSENSSIPFPLQGFITDNERALEDLFGDDENTRRGDACLNVMATRIATVFASLRVYTFTFPNLS